MFGEINIELIIAILSGVISLVAMLISAYTDRRSQETERVRNFQEGVEKYHLPLARAAHELQRRLFGLIDSTGSGGARTTFSSPEEREIYLGFTLFVIGDFLGWFQVVRRHCNIYAPNADSQERSRKMEEYLDSIVKAWTTTQRPDGFFRLQRGELQALGELFCSPTGSLTAELSQCITFIDFHKRYKEEESPFSFWFHRLDRDCSALIDGPVAAPSKERVIEVQRACVNLIEFLDPVCKVIPQRARRLLPMPPGMKSLIDGGGEQKKGVQNVVKNNKVVEVSPKVVKSDKVGVVEVSPKVVKSDKEESGTEVKQPLLQNLNS